MLPVWMQTQERLRCITVWHIVSLQKEPLQVLSVWNAWAFQALKLVISFAVCLAMLHDKYVGNISQVLHVLPGRREYNSFKLCDSQLVELKPRWNLCMTEPLLSSQIYNQGPIEDGRTGANGRSSIAQVMKGPTESPSLNIYVVYSLCVYILSRSWQSLIITAWWCRPTEYPCRISLGWNRRLSAGGNKGRYWTWPCSVTWHQSRRLSQAPRTEQWPIICSRRQNHADVLLPCLWK